VLLHDFLMHFLFYAIEHSLKHLVTTLLVIFIIRYKYLVDEPNQKHDVYTQPEEDNYRASVPDERLRVVFYKF
jgi:hypothetical protein